MWMMMGWKKRRLHGYTDDIFLSKKVFLNEKQNHHERSAIVEGVEKATTYTRQEEGWASVLVFTFLLVVF
jgi:hypothetical protein